MILHSIVDVITNSSSTTFVFSDKDSVAKIKEFISEILKAVNIDANVDDYFDVSLDYGDYDDEYDEDEVSYRDLCAKLKIVPKNDTAKNLFSLAASAIVVWDSYSEDCVKNGKTQDNSILGELRDYAC